MDNLSIDPHDATPQQLLAALLEGQVALSDKLDAALTDLQADITAVVDYLKGQIPALRTTIATLEGQVAGLQGDKTALLGTVDTLKQQAADLEAETLARIGDIDQPVEGELPPAPAPNP